MKYGEDALVRGVSRGLLTQNDADLIKEYVTELQVCRNISNGRVLKYIYTLINWQKFLPKPFAELKIGDVGPLLRRTAMPEVYVHLSGGDIKRKMLEKAGFVDTDKEQEKTLEPVECPRCRSMNPYDAMYCYAPNVRWH